MCYTSTLNYCKPECLASGKAKAYDAKCMSFVPNYGFAYSRQKNNKVHEHSERMKKQVLTPLR